MENELQQLIEQGVVMMGLGPLVGFLVKALIGAGVGLGANKLFGGGGGGGTGSPNLDRASGLQADALASQNALFNRILGLINTTAAGGPPPSVRFDLDNPQDFGELFEGIAPMGELNQLKELFGLSRGDTGAIQSAAGLSEARAQGSAQQGGDIANLITQLLLNVDFGSGNNLAPPVTDQGFLDTILNLDTPTGRP